MANHKTLVKLLMLDHNLAEMSESEEMYLISIARLVEQGVEAPVPIPLLAGELSIQPVSANQMVHKLAEEELVEYLPYKGVQLTPKGREIALKVLRDRRLWEVFLVDHLDLPPSDADALACRLEHLTAEGVASRLANYLGQPSVSPQGLPIPEVDGETIVPALRPLTDLALGECAEVLRVEGDQATQSFLLTEGLRPGVTVKPLAIGSEGAMLLETGDKRLNLAKAVTDKILINV
jgi:DtxR family Mn-dependent transcriptional regulator